MPIPFITLEHGKPVRVNIIPATDHVVIYKLWIRQSPADAWRMAGQGTTVHDAPDSHDLGPLGAGAALAYWFGVAGTGGSAFEVKVVFDQAPPPVDGVLVVQGTTDASGGAVVEDRVVVR
ncbi:MAG TPA: hypothetical protein VN914_06670 [Polyangia bacterium]|nr:hypothetical protein [Polyangia bacterium]